MPPTASAPLESPSRRSILDDQRYTTAVPPSPVARISTARHPECTRTTTSGALPVSEEEDEDEE